MEEDIKILEELIKEGFSAICPLEAQAIENLIKGYKEQERQLKIKDNYLDLIHGLGFDYDGFNTVESLKALIDELVDYAVKAIAIDDKYAVYESIDDKQFNILYEVIENDNHIPHVD